MATSRSKREGTAGNDVNLRIGNFDELDGLAGNDNLYGDARANTLKGGAGNDILWGLGGRDELYGGADRDVLLGGAGADRLYGGAGNDVLVDRDGDGNGDRLWGEAGDDVLVGDRDSFFKGGDGADVLLGLEGGTALYSGSPDGDGVTVNLATGRGEGGDAEGDVLIDIHRVVGSNGDDTLTGDEQDNYFRGRGGADVLDGGGGRDFAAFNAGGVNEGVTVDLSGVKDSAGYITGKGGDAEGDKLKNIENLNGSNGDDTLRGDGEANELTGMGGDDVLEGRGGADDLDGSKGTDTASYAHSPGGVTVNLETGTASGGDAQVTVDGVTSYDKLTSIENLEGSAHADTLTGDANDNKLEGGGGADTLTGGGEADTFVFGEESIFKNTETPTREQLEAAADTVTDFTRSQGDKLDLRGVAASQGLDNLHFDTEPARNRQFQGRVWYEKEDGDTHVLVDVDGKNGADFLVTLEGEYDLTAADMLGVETYVEVAS